MLLARLFNVGRPMPAALPRNRAELRWLMMMAISSPSMPLWHPDLSRTDACTCWPKHDFIDNTEYTTRLQESRPYNSIAEPFGSRRNKRQRKTTLKTLAACLDLTTHMTDWGDHLAYSSSPESGHAHGHGSTLDVLAR